MKKLILVSAIAFASIATAHASISDQADQATVFGPGDAHYGHISAYADTEYQVELNGKVLPAFGTGSLFDINFLESIEHKLKKRHGRIKYNDIVLKRSAGENTDWGFDELIEEHQLIEDTFNIPAHNEKKWKYHIEKFEEYNGCDDHSACAGTLTLVPVSPVPVPAAVWLFASGLIGLVGLARRKV